MSNRNSYPYYQDKKRLVSLVLKTTQKKHSKWLFFITKFKRYNSK